jgi:hypothetical protein
VAGQVAGGVQSSGADAGRRTDSWLLALPKSGGFHQWAPRIQSNYISGWGWWISPVAGRVAGACPVFGQLGRRGLGLGFGLAIAGAAAFAELLFELADAGASFVAVALDG